MVTNPTEYSTISPYVIPGIKFEMMPYLDQEYKAEKIIESVCEFFKVPVSDVIGKSRKTELIPVRFWCAWFVRANTTLSYKSIGKVIGDRHHTTILNAISIIQEQLKWDMPNDFKTQYKLLIKVI